MMPGDYPMPDQDWLDQHERAFREKRDEFEMRATACPPFSAARSALFDVAGFLGDAARAAREVARAIVERK